MNATTLPGESKARAGQTADSETGPVDVFAESFQLANWQVRPQRNQLYDSSQEETRRLEPRLMKLLCVLAHRQGEVLTREQLDDLLWPDSIVNENSLTRAISELRRKLTPSSASASVFIETIPKKGYRLAVPIELSPELASPKNNSHGIRGKACLHPVISYESAEKRTSAYATLLMAAVLIVMVTALLQTSPAILPRGSKPFADELIRSATRMPAGGELILSNSTPTERGAGAGFEWVFSNDGSQFAYVVKDQTGFTIVLASTEGLTSTAQQQGSASHDNPVPVYHSTDMPFNLVWSPLGNALLFASQPSVITPAPLGSTFEFASGIRLYSLDLDSLEVSVLLEEKASQLETLNTEQNLT